MKIGIIGYGRMAREYEKVLSFLGHKVCCFLTRHASHQIYITNTWKLFLDYNPEAIIIAIDIEETAEVLRRAIGTGLPILVEKPVCISSKEIYNITQKYERQVMVGYNRRYYNNVKIIKKDLKKMKLVSVYVNIAEPLLYSGVHILDLLLYLFGGIWLESRWNISSHSHSCLFTAHDNQIPILFHATEESYSNSSITFTFDNGIVYLLCPIEELRIFNGFHTHELHGNRLYTPHIATELHETATNDYKCGLLEQVRDFCLLKDRSSIGCDLQQAARVLQLYEEIIGG